MSSQSTDVAIVGAGVVGVAAALELASRGASVTVIERGSTPAAACSAGNAGILGASEVAPLANPEVLAEGLRYLLQPRSPFALRPRPSTVPWLARFLLAANRARDGSAALALRELASASVEMHRELDRRFDIGVTERGMLTVYRSEAEFEAARRRVRAADESAPREEVIDADRTLEHCPQLREKPVGGIFAPDDLHCDPFRYVTVLAEQAASAGVDIRTGTEVLGIRRRGARARALWTTAGDIPAESIVVAAGVWSPELTADLPITVPIQGGKGYHVDLVGAENDIALPTYFPDCRVVATPLGDRLRLSGMLELCGTDMSVDRGRVDAIARHGVRALEGIEGRAVVEIWRGLRPCSADGMPIIGPVPRVPNVVLATGHGMWGLQLAPVTARMVADYVEDLPVDGAARALRPERFASLPGRR